MNIAFLSRLSMKKQSSPPKLNLTLIDKEKMTLGALELF